MLWFIENRKKEFDDEKVPMPEIFKAIIAVAVIALLFFGTNKVIDWAERLDMESSGQTEFIEE